MEIIHMQGIGGGITGTLMDGIVQNELSVGTDLGIISGFELSVPHVVLFHAHEGRILICLTERITIPQFLQLRFVFGKTGRYSSCSFLTCFFSALFIPERRLFKALTFSRKPQESISGKASGALSCLSCSICLSTSLRIDCIFDSSFTLFFSTLPRQTKV